VVIRLLENVRQTTIRPLVQRFTALGTRVYTDEYEIGHRWPERGFDHPTVCHGRGEYARDDDGDGCHEIHVNTVEGFWSLLRSWLRPHRGISQKYCRSTWAFFRSCITRVFEARADSGLFWSDWWHHQANGLESTLSRPYY